MPNLVKQIAVRDPSDYVVKGFGPQDNPVPDWVREAAPRAELWADDVIDAEVVDDDPEPEGDAGTERKPSRRKSG